jgi:hypothetical protein
MLTLAASFGPENGSPPPQPSRRDTARAVATVGGALAGVSLLSWGLGAYQANICESVTGKSDFQKIKCVDAKMQTRISKHIAVVGGVIGLVGLVWMGVKEAA